MGARFFPHFEPGVQLERGVEVQHGAFLDQLGHGGVDDTEQANAAVALRYYPASTKAHAAHTQLVLACQPSLAAPPD